MINRLSAVCGVVVASIAAPCAVAGPELLLAAVTYSGVGQTSAVPSWTPFISYGDPNLPGATTMSGPVMDVVDIVQGNTYDLTGDLAAFDLLAGDGLNQGLHIGFTVPSGTGSVMVTTEFDMLQSASSVALGVGAPDFGSYSLTRIEVIGSSFLDMGDGSFETSFQFSFYGVPTPGALALFGLAGAASARRRR